MIYPKITCRPGTCTMVQTFALFRLNDPIMDAKQAALLGLNL